MKSTEVQNPRRIPCIKPICAVNGCVYQDHLSYNLFKLTKIIIIPRICFIYSLCPDTCIPIYIFSVNSLGETVVFLNLLKNVAFAP